MLGRRLDLSHIGSNEVDPLITQFGGIGFRLDSSSVVCVGDHDEESSSQVNGNFLALTLREAGETASFLGKDVKKRGGGELP